MSEELGCDISNYSAVPTAEQLDCWWEKGIRFVIVGCQREATATAQLEALSVDGRFLLEAYQYYYWDGSELERTERALEVMARFGLNRLWVDVEQDRGDVSQSQVRQAIKNAVAKVESADLVAGIYSGSWCFPGLTGNTTEFTHLPLWNASYTLDGQPPDFDRFRPYGGWVRPEVWQYTGSTDLCGVNVDLNIREFADPKNGWEHEGNFEVLFNSGVPVLRIGSLDGQFPGRFAKNFGGQWVFLRSNESGDAFWALEEGD